MERLIASPLAHITALAACFTALSGVLVELVRGVWEFMLRLFFELPLLVQSCELIGWYVAFATLTWALISMMSPLDEEDEESSGHLVIVGLDYGPFD